MHMLLNKRVLAVLVVVIVSIVALRSSEAPQSTPSNPRGAVRSGELRIPVRGVVVVPRPFENKIHATGNVLAAEEVELRSEASGKVTGISFKEGTHVGKGDLLVKINDAELKAQLRKTASRKKLLEEKEARQRTLREGNLISQEQYDEVKNDLNGIVSEEELLAAQILKTEIRAPFDGVVGLRYVSEGSYITPATPVARMQDIRSIKIEFSIPEKYAGVVQKGTKIRFGVEGTSRQHEGTVYAVEPKIDPGTRTLRLRALARNEKESVLPGSFAKIEIHLKRMEDAVLIPTHAVIPDVDGQKVFVAKNGVAMLTKVDTGLRMEEQIHIVNGLQANDTLITTGLLQLRSGMPVNVTVDR